VLVQLGVGPRIGVGAREQLLVRVLDDEDVLDVRAVLELVEDRQQRAVDDDHAVAGVRRDVREVAGWRRRFSVCGTKPPHGIPKYAS
jgi:hypothetical protein